MRIDLIRFTPNPDELCGAAAALCTNYGGDPLKALRGALSRGHESVAEHASFTFKLDDVSRVLLAQLTRHRIAAFSVQSQRYCGISENIVMPESIRRHSPEARTVFSNAAAQCLDAYYWLIDHGIEPEDARFCAPEGETTALIVTMNARELRHFFALRCCNRAQWEIRKLADIMLEECKVVAPELFRGAGCACMRGEPCPEGRASCGKPRGRAD